MGSTAVDPACGTRLVTRVVDLLRCALTYTVSATHIARLVISLIQDFGCHVKAAGIEAASTNVDGGLAVVLSGQSLARAHPKSLSDRSVQ